MRLFGALLAVARRSIGKRGVLPLRRRSAFYDGRAPESLSNCKSNQHQRQRELAAAVCLCYVVLSAVSLRRCL